MFNFKALRPIITLVFTLGLLALLSTQISCTKKSGKVENLINYRLKANIKGLDPAFTNDVYAHQVVSQIYEGLFQYHYLKRPLEVVPVLADGMPTVSKDGLTHTFKIKKGVYYHDSEAFPDGKGREVKAQDFIYCWKRLTDPANAADGSWIFEGKIAGLDEWREKMSKGEATMSSDVEGFSAPDDYTVVIKLKRPYYQLYYVLTMPYASVYPKEAIDKYGKEFLNHPVGTGPFKFESWIRNSKVTLVKDEKWNRETYPTEGEAGDKEKGLLNDAGAKIPFIDKIVFHEIVESQPAWLQFQKGGIDVLEIPKDNFDSAITGKELNAEMKAKGMMLDINVEPDLTYTVFNMMDPILGKNANLRKAIALATDTNISIDKFYNGRAIPAHSPIPPGVDSYDPDFKSPYQKHDLEKAKEYMIKAGYPEGKGLPEITYSTNNSTTLTQMAEQVKLDLSKIGIKVKIDIFSWPQFTDQIRNKKLQFWGIAWLGDYPDSENFLQLLYGKNISPGPNGANYQNPEFDKLYEQASVLPPGEARTKLYRKMIDIFIEDMPWVTNVHRLGYRMYQGWIQNFKYHSMIATGFKYVKVDPKLQKELKEKL